MSAMLILQVHSRGKGRVGVRTRDEQKSMLSYNATSIQQHFSSIENSTNEQPHYRFRYILYMAIPFIGKQLGIMLMQYSK
jgi:hypothetical protein